MDWQPIETAPKDGTAVLVSTWDGIVGEANFHEDHGWWWANTYLDYCADKIESSHGAVTHWMPLPEPPK